MPSSRVRDVYRATNHAPISGYSKLSPLTYEDEPLAFSFLLDVTNPHAESRVKPFSTVSRRDEKEASLDNTLTPSSFNEADAFNGFMVHDHAFLQGFEEDYLDDVWGPVDPNLGPYVSPVPDTNPIVDQIKLQEALRNIITELEDFDTSLVSSNKIGWIRFDPGLARKILVAENLRTFIACFFRYSHPEIPIVHRPSFEEEASTPGLLLALFLCGSMHAAPTDDALSARRFFDIAEEYAFHKLATYVAAYDRQVAPVQAKEFHQTFLAALLMHYLQFPMNKIAVRERNRDQRLSVLISTVRKMGFTNIKHIPPSDERFSWEQFIFQETQIRIANWTLLAAWQQSAIFHHPCSMTILEMACDFPCLEELWEARNAVEFGTILTVQGESVVSSQSSSMRECFNALMDDKWCGPQGFPQRLHSLQDMQFLIQAIYCSILSARFMGTLTLSKPGFERAIARWQELWDSIVEQSWVCASFASRHSLEFLLLSRKLLEASSSTDQDSAYLSGVAHSSTDELHDFLKRALDLNS
ncbi:Fc.00g048870.m01.CDS01 [Cosmosporella sp. VM-42]